MTVQDLIPLIAAIGGGAGLGAVGKSFVDVVLALRAGVAPREGKRKRNIVQARDDALSEARMATARAVEAEADAAEAVEAARLDRARANREVHRAEWAESNMRIARQNEQRGREHAAELRVLLMEAGSLRRDQLPEWPRMEAGIPRPTLQELNREDTP